MSNYKIGSNIDIITVEVNDRGDSIKLSADDSGFVRRFLEMAIFLKDKAQEASEWTKAFSERKEKATAEDILEQLRLDEKYASICMESIEKVFGKGVLQKYFYEQYEEVENFTPGVQHFLDFIEQFTPVIAEIYKDSNGKPLISERVMEKYKPQDYKKLGK